MARGDKDYFRHSFRARNDDFIVSLIREMREKGYFMWFALIELCSERMADGDDPPYTFDQSTLYKELRCTKHTLNQFLTLTKHMLKIDSTYVEPIFNIDIKNLNKFNGYYPKKAPKERKEKKRKEKKSKSAEQKIHSVIFRLAENDFANSVVSSVKTQTQELWIDMYCDKEWIDTELLKASAWILENKNRAPKSNYGKFFSSWLSRGWESFRKTKTGNQSAYECAKNNILNNPFPKVKDEQSKNI